MAWLWPGLVLVACSSISAGPEAPRAATSAVATVAPTATPELTATVDQEAKFEGERAFEHLLAQMDMGPRWPGSDGHAQVRQYIRRQMIDLGWQVEVQSFEYQGFQAQNIIARSGLDEGPIIIVGAHYDTRRIADESNTTAPVPGAVDGASGVAVLLELARALDLTLVDNEIWLTFFDIEDQGRGGMPGFDWAAGAAYMAQNLTIEPEAMILVDMIGDADQQLYYEGNSDHALRDELWQLAASLGYGGVFIPQERHSVIDDHLPFVQKGIPAVDIIDFDYPYWHTTEDTADKASPASLERVGRTVEAWLER